MEAGVQLDDAAVAGYDGALHRHWGGRCVEKVLLDFIVILAVFFGYAVHVNFARTGRRGSFLVFATNFPEGVERGSNDGTGTSGDVGNDEAESANVSVGGR